MKKIKYLREVFSVKSMQDAKDIILTPEADATVNERWEKETPAFAALIGQAFTLDENSMVLDYGCGIGRLSKALIENHGCRVQGVDISDDMHRLAVEYVDSDRFSICFPEDLKEMIEGGFSADYALSIYVLQHTLRPGIEIMRVRECLKPGGQFLVLNNQQRCVPTDHGWINDGKDVRQMLCNNFLETGPVELPVEVFGDAITNRTFCKVYTKPE